MANIKNFLNSADKLKHISVSMFIMFLFTALAFLTLNYWPSVIVGSIVTLFCGFGKELYDKTSADRVASWADIIADLIGWIAALIPLIIIGI